MLARRSRRQLSALRGRVLSSAGLRQLCHHRQHRAMTTTAAAGGAGDRAGDPAAVWAVMQLADSALPTG